ncbi:MAG TPA: hypothetical protein VIL86_10845, partial [Tepidisphaeraceae bacterium]
MITVDSAINRFRRDLTLGGLLKLLLLAGAMGCLLAGPFLGPARNSTTLLFAIGGLWLFLSYTSMRSSRLAADSPSLIASGQYEAAEQRIERALGTFSIFRTVKLVSLHHLALLRHAQRRWQESALLSRVLLSQRLGTLQGLAKPSRLILADSLLEMGDAQGAHEAIARLYEQRLTLGEALNLTLIQLDYQSRIGAWEQMLSAVMTKVQLAELMPTNSAARAQAFLALAARKSGNIALFDWLRKRVELLVNVQELCSARPILWELWREPGGAVDRL